MIRIGLSGATESTQERYWEGSVRNYVNDTYVKAILQAGATPVMIPVMRERDRVAAILDVCDGILLTGGEDVSPLLFGEEPAKGIETISPFRDQFDLLLFEMAVDRKIPVMGICRGMQLINVALGGSLIQHIGDVDSVTLQHVQRASIHEGTHHIMIEPDSHLYDVLGARALVNSWHHQAIKELAPDLRAVARSTDGVIEAVESVGDDLPPILGIQWHPEELAETVPAMARLFSVFVEDCDR
ncbi:MAG: gamma-glutamyl-gamma-aminobutyrate hydrolase family protein [Saccharofermentanales bacterium]|jgi:putative glutamine amidotransferase